MKIRGFELVEKYKNETDLLPVRETAHAAGYDLKAAETVHICKMAKFFIYMTALQVLEN